MSAEPIPDILARLHESMTDILARLQHIEQTHLEFLQRIGDVEQIAISSADKATSVEADRNDYRNRVDAVEKLPNTNAESIAALDRRLRAVEGAVGITIKQQREAATNPTPVEPTPVEQPAPSESHHSRKSGRASHG